MITLGNTTLPYEAPGSESIKQKKMLFDVKQISQEDRLISSTILRSLRSDYKRSDWSLPTSNAELNTYQYLCDWYPVLFGIDEDNMPSSEDEEGIFDDSDYDEELERRAAALTESELSGFRVGSKELYTDDELRAIWKKDQKPKYGRRARQKPILERPDHLKFECICEIDKSYSRHHISHFGGGLQTQKEFWKTPNFKAYWEDVREKAEYTELDDWTKIFEKEPEEECGKELKPIPKFPSASPKDIKRFREELKASFRPLDCREVRRYRMPYCEALYLELQEDLYLDSAKFFKHLIITDYYAHLSHDPGPPLRQSKMKMNKLVALLKVAEKFSRQEAFHKEATVLLRTGKYFNEHDETWWWLAEELYRKAVDVGQKCVIDGGKTEAIARYILGTFLLDCVNRVQEAQEQLYKSRELSLGKDWKAKKILKVDQEPIYKECANYLSRALIAASRELRDKKKPEEALPLIHRSYKLCQETRSSRRDIEMETYFELGMTYQALGMLKWAKVAFRKFIEIAKLENHPRSVCDGFLEMAICFRTEGDLFRCLNSLHNYLDVATENNDVNLIAFANRYIGEFHLHNGNPKVALEFLEKSFSSFLDQFKNCQIRKFEYWEEEHFTLPHDVELTRALCGLAEGELLTKSFCQLILQARDSKNQKEIEQLMTWKNKGEKVIEVEEKELETPSFIIEPDPTTIKSNLGQAEESREGSVEYLGEITQGRTVRFALDQNQSAIIL